MNPQTQTSVNQTFTIHPDTRLGYVHLSVADLERQITFYERVLGFKLHWREGANAGLGAGDEDLLRLTQVDGARRVQRTTGMYHFAVLFPNRKELARAVARLFALRYPNYPTDHVVSKTTYLDDPEGNNIELYILSPEDGTFSTVNGELVVRRADGRLSDGREPLDVEALFRELTPDDRLDEPLPEGTQIGHVHLYGANLDDSAHFYHDILGFPVISMMSKFRMGDVGLNSRWSHVIAFNTWQGEGTPPPPPNSLGLRYFTIVLPDVTELERVAEQVSKAGIAVEQTERGLLIRDPSQISILLTDSEKLGLR